MKRETGTIQENLAQSVQSVEYAVKDAQIQASKEVQERKAIEDRLKEAQAKATERKENQEKGQEAERKVAEVTGA